MPDQCRQSSEIRAHLNVGKFLFTSISDMSTVSSRRRPTVRAPQLIGTNAIGVPLHLREKYLFEVELVSLVAFVLLRGPVLPGDSFARAGIIAYEV